MADWQSPVPPNGHLRRTAHGVRLLHRTTGRAGANQACLLMVRRYSGRIADRFILRASRTGSSFQPLGSLISLL